MANTPIPSQIDYTSRDYASLRDDLLARVKLRLPDWNSTDPADFGVALVEAFAYMGDLMSYYIDRAANEASLATATRRASVVAIARDLGYEATGYSPSSVTITFTNNGNASVTIPAGTVLTATVESGDTLLSIPFTTDSAVTVPALSTAKVTCTQGESRPGTNGYGESLGVSSGDPSMFFELPDKNVIKSSVQVYVYDGVNYFPWQRVDQIADYSPLSRVFSVTDNGADIYYVTFGDGISGLVPSSGHAIFATYRVVDGTNGNVPSGTITEITSVPGLTSNQVSVLTGTVTSTNDSAATGGTDPEDLESIRTNAARAYRTTNRAVTLEDYQNIALKVDNCGKASAQSQTPGSVVVAVAPYRNAGTAEERPGFLFNSETSTWSESPELTALKSSVTTTLTSNALAGTQVSVVSPVYSYLKITVSATALSAVRASDAEVIIKQAILDRFDYSRAQFGSAVYVTDLVALVSSLGVTSSVSVSELRRQSSGSGASDVVASEDELLLLLASGLTVTMTGGA